MDSKLVIVVGIIVIVVIAGAAMTMKGNPGGNQQTATTRSSQSPSTTTSGQGGTLRLEGEWRGTYKGQYGSGGWTWIIKAKPGGGYVGCLQTTGKYSSGGGWMPITIEVSGSKITIGSVGGGGVIFTGTITGTSASGTWRFANNADHGSWSGSRVGPAGDLPCLTGPGGSTQTATVTTTPPKTTGTMTTTTPPSGGATNTVSAETGPCSPNADEKVKEPLESVERALHTVYPDATFTCDYNMSAIVLEIFNITINGASADNETGAQIAQLLQQLGWHNVTYGYSPMGRLVEVAASGYNDNSGIVVVLSLQDYGNNTVRAAIEFQIHG